MILQTVVPALVSIDHVLPPPGPSAYPVIGFMLGAVLLLAPTVLLVKLGVVALHVVRCQEIVGEHYIRDRQLAPTTLSIVCGLIGLGGVFMIPDLSQTLIFRTVPPTVFVSVIVAPLVATLVLDAVASMVRRRTGRFVDGSSARAEQRETQIVSEHS